MKNKAIALKYTLMRHCYAKKLLLEAINQK